MTFAISSLIESIVKGDIAGVKTACECALREGFSPFVAIDEGMSKGLQIVGDKFQAGEFYLVDLISAAEAMKEGLKVLEPHLGGNATNKIGKIVLGTVAGDLHSIGKDLACTLLRGVGFEVIDLGVDVPTERFLEAVRLEKPAILGLSALITSTMPEMGHVVQKLKDDGLREHTKVIVGGAPVSSDFALSIEADSYAPNAPKGADICKQWVAK